MNPLKEDRRHDGDRDGALMYSRLINEWGGVPSGFIQLGTGVLQGGTPMGGDAPAIRATRAGPSQGHPRPRVWRATRQ